METFIKTVLKLVKLNLTEIFIRTVSKIGDCKGVRKEWVGAVVFFFFIEDLAY
jgi:hypothetical protein